MHDSPPMRFVERGCDLRADFERIVERETATARSAGNAILQRLAIHELHYENPSFPDRLDAIQCCDVRMIQRS